MRNTLRKVKVVGVLAALLVITSGCMQESVSVRVYDDGSADVNIRVAVDYAKLSAMASMLGGMSGETSPGMPAELDVCEQISVSNQIPTAMTLPGGVTQTPFKDDKWCGVEISGTVTDVREINNVFGAVQQRTMAIGDYSDAEYFSSETTVPVDDTLDDMQFEKLPDGGWSFKLADPLDCESNDTTVASDGFGTAGESMLEDFELQFAIQMPGSPGENNATSVDGDIFSWKFGYRDMESFCAGTDVSFHAVTTPGVANETAVQVTEEPTPRVIAAAPGAGSDDERSSTLLILGGAATLVLLGGGGAVTALRRRRG
jgi:hypothetical protein